MQRLLIHINKFFCVLTSYFLYKLKTFSVSLLKATKYGPIHLLWSYRCALKTVYGIPFAQYVWLLNWNQSLWKWCVAYKQHFLKLYVDCCWNILKCNAVKSCNIYAVQQDTWSVLTFRRRTFFQILAHPLFKMWVIQKPNKVALWNKWHFEEEKMEITQHV